MWLSKSNHKRFRLHPFPPFLCGTMMGFSLRPPLLPLLPLENVHQSCYFPPSFVTTSPSSLSGRACTLLAAPPSPFPFGRCGGTDRKKPQDERARYFVRVGATMIRRLHPTYRALRYQERYRRRVLLGTCVLVCLVLGAFVLPYTSASDVARPSVSMASVLPRATVGEGDNATHATGEVRMETRHNTSGASQPVKGSERGGHELHSRYAAELKQIDALDVLPLRPRERRISFMEFAHCLGTLLSVSPDKEIEEERGDLASHRYAPFLISVTLENTQDLKALICNLTMPYRYIVLAQNGDTPEVTPFFHLLHRVFAFTRRLTVLQFPDNIGYAGAVNAGLREALSHPFSEVPYVHIVHNDVRFLFSSHEECVARAYNTTTRDKVMIEALEKEVATEPNEYTPLIRQPDGLRKPLLPGTPLPQQQDRKPFVVTSALLPDRMRYMTPSKRAELMAGYTSFMFANSYGHYTSVFLSRLAVQTVGFFDENFFPILYDDTDYRWRAHLLGFAEDHNAAMDDKVISFDLDCVNQVMSDTDDGTAAEGLLLGVNREATRPTLSPYGKALRRDCRKAFFAGVQYAYMQQKWGIESMAELMQAHTSREPFNSDDFSGKLRLPLDAWVVDTDRLTNLRTWLRDVGRHILDVENYNTDVILRAVSP
ncbi:galactofuranosyltransferase lpg1-like protein [Leishmania tarentolae]|uniref:Galactofuranosyltransferase lpg1-like protein n=1 Tax=Leishmania tarentolae TaxID=5689 RepID=A0A640KIM0_LEITA|nr:galactofuranosyltransferase lpg1-like protein [Leishmania tarentolae]